MSQPVSRSRDAAQADGHGVPRLLLIEPLASGRRTLRDVLDEAGEMLCVEHVTSLPEGLARLRRERMSAVLLDLTLPEARSLAAVDELRKVAPQIAIMVLAPAADQALARRALDRGANDFIVIDQIDTRSVVQLIAMMFERRASDEQKFVERERAEVTLNSIGDAVMTTDTVGSVTYLERRGRSVDGMDQRRGLCAAPRGSLRRHRWLDRASRARPVAAGDGASEEGTAQRELRPRRPGRSRDGDRTFGGANSRSARAHAGCRDRLPRHHRVTRATA